MKKKNQIKKSKIIILYYINIILISTILLTFALSIKTYGQDVFITKYKTDRQTIASLAVLIFKSPIFILSDQLKIFIESNKDKFLGLSEIYEKNIDNDFDINTEIYDSASALMRFKAIRQVFSKLELDEYKFFLLDFAQFLFYEDNLSLSLRKFFKEHAKEDIYFTEIQIKLSTNENLFLHQKDIKKGLESYIYFKSSNINSLLFELLKFLYRERTFYTTILPKSITLTKNEQQNYLNITGRNFIYPEAESMLETIFIIYCLSNITNSIFQYTGISIEQYIDSYSFFYKNTWINELIKRWDSLNNNSIFKFPKPYGQKFLDIISQNDIKNSKSNFSKIIQLNPDITCIISIAQGMKLNKNKIDLIFKKLKKIGFNNIIFKSEYDLNDANYSSQKKVFLNIINLESENNSSFNIIKDKKQIQFQQTLIKSFTEIAAISFFDNIEILIMVNKSSTDSLMKGINLILELKDQPIIKKRNIFQKIFDFLISLVAPLSL